MREVIFQPRGVKTEIEAEATILDAARKAGLSVEGTCGGRGTCGKCRVRILKGNREAFTSAEEKHLSPAERKRGTALACQCRGLGDLEVYLPQVKVDLARKGGGVHRKLGVNTSLKKIYLELPRPSLADPRSDEKRLTDALGDEIKRPLSLLILETLPSLLRQADFKFTAVLSGGEVINLEPGDTTNDLFGVAFDVGTTTVVGNLADLNSGEIIAVSSASNAQQSYGADVISRIQYCRDNPDGLEQLQRKVLEVLNQIIEQLVAATGISPLNIYQITAVGNTTMAHLLLGLDPANLAPSPFVPVFQSQVTVEAKELGILTHPGARFTVLPNVAGYVGSDTVAVMLAVNAGELPGRVLIIDIGTNGEMILAIGGTLWTCSTAAGPAFEGAQIKCGMRAAEGAIEKMRIGEDVKLEVIGNAEPVGICGSGLIDAVAELLKAGVIDRTGRLLPPEKIDAGAEIKGRLRKDGGLGEFVLAYGTKDEGDVVITQKDIRELQLAKGAIRAGVEILLKETGITAAELDQILLAGAFGNYIDRQSALEIGLLPEVEAEKVKSVGNAAGDGSLLALVNESELAKAQNLALAAKHIELSTRSDFQELFLKACGFDQSAARKNSSLKNGGK